MRRTVVLSLLGGWLLGSVTALGGVVLSSNVYDYRLIGNAVTAGDLVNQQGWEVVNVSTDSTSRIFSLRRPRFRVP